MFLPGYLFLYTRLEEEKDLNLLTYMEDVYRILGDDCNGRELRGSDFAFAEWLLQNDGVIGISRIRHVGEKMEILSGPMRYFMKDIIKVDKHTKNAQVRMDFLGELREIWLAFDFVDGE